MLTSARKVRQAELCPWCLCCLLAGPRSLQLTSAPLSPPRRCHPDPSSHSFDKAKMFLCNLTSIRMSDRYLFQGHVKSPHHFSILERVFSACFISALMVFRLPSTLSSCWPCSSSICRVPVPVTWVWHFNC